MAKKMDKKNPKSLRLIIIISFIVCIVIIIASFFMHFSSSGFCATNSAGYFAENMITGQCSFAETPKCYPWYYRQDCDTTEKKVETAQKTVFYNETIIQCNSICKINNAKKYCYIDAFPGVSCNDLVKCASITC